MTTIRKIKQKNKNKYKTNEIYWSERQITLLTKKENNRDSLMDQTVKGRGLTVGRLILKYKYMKHFLFFFLLHFALKESQCYLCVAEQLSLSIFVQLLHDQVGMLVFLLSFTMRYNTLHHSFIFHENWLVQSEFDCFLFPSFTFEKVVFLENILQ